jgi:hypothetical protein
MAAAQPEVSTDELWVGARQTDAYTRNLVLRCGGPVSGVTGGSGCGGERLRRDGGVVGAVLTEPMAPLLDELFDAPVIDVVLAGELGY